MKYFLHGNLGSKKDWDGFGDGVRVDLWASAGLDFQQWADQFCDRVRSDNNDENILVGYSLGGRLALHALIAGGKDLWSRAVIISAHPGLTSEVERSSRLKEDSRLAENVRSMPWQDFLDTWNHKSVLTTGAGSKHQVELEIYREQIGLAFEHWSLGKQDDLRGSLSETEVPIRWITGAKDVKFSSLARELSSLLPDCKHIVIPNCGHRVIFDAPVSARISID